MVSKSVDGMFAIWARMLGVKYREPEFALEEEAVVCWRESCVWKPSC